MMNDKPSLSQAQVVPLQPRRRRRLQQGRRFIIFTLVMIAKVVCCCMVGATGRCGVAAAAPFGLQSSTKKSAMMTTMLSAVQRISRGGGGTPGGMTAPAATSTSAIIPCCWITSQSLPKTVREGILKQIALSSSSLQIAQPADCWEAASMIQQDDVGQHHTPPVILFRPDTVDLQRGEGLWTMLGPIMERIIALNKNRTSDNTKNMATLCVIAPTTMDIHDVQAKLEQAAVRLIPFLATNQQQQQHGGATGGAIIHEGKRNVVTLRDVFANVQYVSSPQEAIAVCTEMGTAVSPKAITTISVSSPLNMIRTTVSNNINNKWIHPPMTPANLAAARNLGVDARRLVSDTMEKIRRACTTETGEVKMVANFGDLCRAALKQAKLVSNKKKNGGLMIDSDVAKQMQVYVQRSLEHSMADLYDQQVELLEAACFEEFRTKLSTLKITPNLPSDMVQLAQVATTKFANASNRMAPPGAGTSAPASAFHRRLTDYVATRLLKAQASNKFRPVPRKGVTVGLHWLLPKPFGNDYRQEPWKVHATDRMVYVPSALADVKAEQVADGTWRDAIVPLPSGKDMLYMQ